MKKYTILLLSFLLGTAAMAQTQSPAEQENYTKVITDRSAKIIAGIGITDSTSKKFIKVRDILVDHYRVTGTLHDGRNAEVKQVKASGLDKAAMNTKLASLDSVMNLKLDKHHAEFLAKLNKEITPEQVEGVKDAMTYKKVAVTYNSYLDELPQLTDAQKVQLKAWLIEAREKAVDAGSSDEKTAIFGKYKGRINNYLSKEGYDMKKAGEEWQKRIKERAVQKG